MNIGRYRHRITIERQQTVLDPDTNEPTKTWVPFAKRWATIQPLRSREYWAAAQVQSEATHTIRMRYTPGIRSDMRIVFKDRIFDIVGPPRNLDEENRITELLVKEVEP